MQNVTSPVTPRAVAPSLMAAWTCAVMSGVPGATLTTEYSTPAFPNTIVPMPSAAWVADGTSMVIIANFSTALSAECWA